MPNFRVTNLANKDFVSEWSLTLFDDAQLAEWEAYKQTTAYAGDPTQPSIVAMRRRMPEFTKLREFVNSKGYGELIEGLRKVNSPNGVYDEREVNRKFVLKAGESIIVNGRQVKAFEYLKRRQVEQTLKPGEVSPKIVNEGVFSIEEVTEQPESKVAAMIEGITAKDLEQMSYDDLKSLAKSRGMATGNMKKADLLMMLQETL